MSDFAPVDGRGVWSVSPGASGGVRGRPVEVAAPEARRERPAGAGAGAGARRIVDEVELSEQALRASGAGRPSREEVVALARERIASGYYDRPEVLERTIDRAAYDLTA